MPSRTGTASQVDASGGDGNTTVTVPADCDVIVAFVCHWDSDSQSTLDGLTLDGDSFTFFAQEANDATLNGMGVAALVNPSTGSQTLAWTWSAGGARSEGGEIVLVYVKDGNTADPVRDAAVANAASGTLSVDIDTESDDLLLGFGEVFFWEGGDPGLNLTAFINDAQLNSQIYDVGEDTTPTTPTATVSVANVSFGSVAGISLKAAASGGDTELEPADASHAHEADAVELTQAHLLAAASAAHAQTAGVPVLVQSHILDAADAAHEQAAEEVELTQAHVLALADAAHGHAADNVVLSQAHLLVVQDASHDHAADNIVLTVAGVLDVAGAAHAHTADSVALTQAHVLAVADAAHGHAADSVTLSLGLLLTVADALQSHAVDNVALTQAHVLTVAEALHGHSAANVVLEQAQTLSVDRASHGHAAESPTLSLADILSVADAVHEHTADEIELTQQHVLIVSDAVHAQIAELVDVRLPGLAASREVFMITAEDRIYLITPETQRVVN